MSPLRLLSARLDCLDAGNGQLSATSCSLNMSSENREICFDYLRRCKEAKKCISGFSEMLTLLQDEVATSGLNDNELKLLTSVIRASKLTQSQFTSMIKCLVPEQRINENIVTSIGLWFVGNAKNLQAASTITIVHWLIGLMDYGLVDMKLVNTFYDWFFYITVKNEKLAPYVSRLVYILTKPDDVSRTQVSRLLSLQAQYTKPKKYLTALLSLFKSYKPEDVPETVPSINIESAWKPIPEDLKRDFQKAAERCNRELSTNNMQSNFNWNPVGGTAKRKSDTESLIPMVNYILIGSSLMREKNAKTVFEIRTLEDLGKHQLNLELPCNSMSLLANTAGLHILTFANTSYQNRFFHNLYNMLQNAFIYEIGKYSYAERDKLLAMTAQLTRYMGQEIILVSRFLQSYVPTWNTRDHRESILALIEWITFPCFADAYNRILLPLRTMWECSVVTVKCEILITLENLVTNLFIKGGLAETRSFNRQTFVGGTQTFDLKEVLEPLINFVQDLIVSGLISEDYNSKLLSAALTFYEQVARLQEHSDLPLWHIAPRALFYGGFLSPTMVNLSRVCSLLLKYRDINTKLRQMGSRDLFAEKIKIIDSCAEDIAKGLLYDEVFSGPKDGYLLRFMPKNMVVDLRISCNADTALNLSNHWATLPYKFTLLDTGLEIHTKEDCMEVAGIYYPEVFKFLKALTD